MAVDTIVKEDISTSQSSAYHANQKQDWKQRPDLIRSREQIRAEIKSLLESRKPRAPSTIRVKLPELSERLEHVLFRNAESELEYLDTITLPERLGHVQRMHQNSLLRKEKKTDCQEEMPHVEYVYNCLQSWRAHLVEEQMLEPQEVLENTQLARIAVLSIKKESDFLECGLPLAKVRAYGHSLRATIQNALHQCGSTSDPLPSSFSSNKVDQSAMLRENPAIDTSYDVSAAVLASLRSVADRAAMKRTPTERKTIEAAFCVNNLKKRRKLAPCVMSDIGRVTTLLPKEVTPEPNKNSKPSPLPRAPHSSIPSDLKSPRDATLPALLPTVEFKPARDMSFVRNTSQISVPTSQRMSLMAESGHYPSFTAHSTSTPYPVSRDRECFNPSLLQANDPAKRIEMYEIENTNLHRLLQQTMHEKYELELKVSRLTQQLLESTPRQR
uniref:Uncharacterized protein AlNc14C30G2782 n=1 Tax=Albugo laibachii Nc14 TaxID=890382 RepID=F0W7H6_9STRA|nr:conserved hypothetical protein [Albugo laibachii Nc14]|eukprot:CCA17077.1 conserved hypothetical protein [Albugo laibachii Nc14]